MFDAHLCLSGVLMWGDRIPGFDRIWDLVLTWNATMGVPNLVDRRFASRIRFMDVLIQYVR